MRLVSYLLDGTEKICDPPLSSFPLLEADNMDRGEGDFLSDWLFPCEAALWSAMDASYQRKVCSLTKKDFRDEVFFDIYEAMNFKGFALEFRS